MEPGCPKRGLAGLRRWAFFCSSLQGLSLVTQPAWTALRNTVLQEHRAAKELLQQLVEECADVEKAAAESMVAVAASRERLRLYVERLQSVSVD